MYVGTIPEVINSRLGAPYQHPGGGGSVFLVAAELVGRTNGRAAALLNKNQTSKDKDGCVELIAVVQLTGHENL